MKLRIKSSQRKPLDRFTMDKEYPVIDTWTISGRIIQPVIKDDLGFTCLVFMENCEHISGEWEVSEGSMDEFKN